MRPVAVVLIAALASSPTLAQTPDTLPCGSFKAEFRRDGQLMQWTVARGTEKMTEKGTLRGAPRFECLDNKALIVEVTFTTGSGTFAVYFPDGTDLTYSRAQIDHRGNRYILPVQAKAKIAPAFQAAFDYHCKMDMPLYPIAPESRADCVKP